MPSHPNYIVPESRQLSDKERLLIQWMIEHSGRHLPSIEEQLAAAEVIGRCACGCASIDFSIKGVVPRASSLTVVADYKWKDPSGALFGAFLFEREGQLAGLEVWSIDGLALPRELPSPNQLTPLDEKDDA